MIISEGVDAMENQKKHSSYRVIAEGGVGERGEITRCSDDGEPLGTAGRPMLEVLTGQEIHNVAAVVPRYFGGGAAGNRRLGTGLYPGLAGGTGRL